MKKRLKKLVLKRETLQHLEFVSGGTLFSDDPTCIDYSCPWACQPAPSVDPCGSGALACYSAAGNCHSGISCGMGGTC